MRFRLEIGSVTGSMTARNETEARETLHGLLGQIGMGLEEWYTWDGDARVGSGRWHVVSGGHEPDVELIALEEQS